MPAIDPVVIVESVKNGAIYAGAVLAESTNAAAQKFDEVGGYEYVASGAQYVGDTASAGYQKFEEYGGPEYVSATKDAVVSGASYAGGKAMEGSYAAYQKFNDAGGTEYVSHAAQSTMAGAAYVGNAVNETIEANPTLAGLKRSTT